MNNIENFYNNWSNKKEAEINHILWVSEHKTNTMIRGFSCLTEIKINKLMDYGCGYGKVLDLFSKHYKAEQSFGFDCSDSAIYYAKEHYKHDKINYFKLPSLDIDKCIQYIKHVIGDKVDCIILTDILEHVPDCKSLISELSKITRYFIIKLPLEKSIIDDYVLYKEYPGPKHSNGHLREFDVNNVHYFVRSLGLIPIHESSYVYNINETFPPYNKYKWKIKLLRLFKLICSFFLPPKIYLRIVGGGGYYYN